MPELVNLETLIFQIVVRFYWLECRMNLHMNNDFIVGLSHVEVDPAKHRNARNPPATKSQNTEKFVWRGRQLRQMQS